MDAARIFCKNSFLPLTALALALAAPGWAQNLVVSPSQVSLNQSTTAQSVTVTSSSSTAITFNPTISYAADGGSGFWLSTTPGPLTTAAEMTLQISSTAGSSVGIHTATVTLTPTTPSGAGSGHHYRDLE